MSYRLMRLRKYYDVLRSNNTFFMASPEQKGKIILNIFRFLKKSISKPLVLNYKPVIAQIEPTSECNLACEMCIREETGMPIGTMSFEDFKKILDRLDSLFKLHLSGQGEPFMNPEIFEMIKYANKRGVTVFFASNGTLLTPSVVEKICNVEVGEIGISIDSPIKEKFEKIRKNADFDRVKENIKNLVKELERNNKKTIVSIGAVLFKDSLDELRDFILFAEEVGVKKLGFQTLQTKDDYLENYDEDVGDRRVEDLKVINEKMEDAKKIAKEKGVSLIFDEEKSPGCVWPWRSIYVTWDGYVTPCCKILNYKKPYFGNILKEDFWKIWNSLEYQNFRRLLRDRKAPFRCKGCDRV